MSPWNGKDVPGRGAAEIGAKSAATRVAKNARELKDGMEELGGFVTEECDGRMKEVNGIKI